MMFVFGPITGVVPVAVLLVAMTSRSRLPVATLARLMVSVPVTLADTMGELKSLPNDSVCPVLEVSV